MAKKKSKKVSPKKRKIQSKSNNQPLYIALGIFFFATLLYSNTFNHGFVLDDDLVCKKNDFVQAGFAGLGDIFTHSWYYGLTDTPDRYYRPMMLAGFAIETSLFGNDAKIYHIMNVLYYALSCTFLFFVINLLFKNKNWLIALGATLLFTAHPLHTEVVANIKSRDEIFAFLGLLGVIYSIIKYNREGKNSFLALALVSYFFAILSKEAALAILGIVPLVLYFFTNTSFQKIATQTVFFGVVAAVYFGIRMNIIDNDPEPFGIIDNSLFAIDSTSVKLATAIGMIGEYFRLLVFPHPLSFDYSYNTFPELGWGNWKVLASLTAIIGLIYMTIKGLVEKNILSFCALFFAITFGITSNIFFLIGATFAERFMFVPLLGFCLSVSYVLYEYLNAENSKQPTSFYAVLGVILLLYSGKTFTQNKVWESDDTLFATGIYSAPNSARTQSFYGVMNYRKSLLPENASRKNELLKTSEEYLKKSLATYPGFTEAYQHLASTYEAQNRLELSLQTYKDALKTKPDYFPAMTNHGIISYKLKRYAEAENYLKQSLEYAPNNITTIRALGLTYRDQGKFNLAVQEFEKALNAYYTVQHLTDLGMTYEQMGDPTKAQFYNQKILELKQGQ